MKILLNLDDGSLHKTDVLEALKASMEENGMVFDTSQLSNMVDAIWEDAKVQDRQALKVNNQNKNHHQYIELH